MAVPAPALRREVDVLIQPQKTTLQQAKPLTELKLADFRARSEKIRSLFKMMDLNRPSPAKPIREREISLKVLATHHDYDQSIALADTAATKISVQIVSETSRKHWAPRAVR